MKGLVMKKEKLFEAFVISILILAFFGVLGLGILATLLWVTRGCFELNGIDIKGTVFNAVQKTPAATAEIMGAVTPSTGWT
jgi:hypothetical protein